MREKWFQKRVENLEVEIEQLGIEKSALEKDKWSWEKEREGLRWLLAFGQWGPQVTSAGKGDGRLSALDGSPSTVLLGSTSHLRSGSRQLTLSPPMGRKLRRSRTLPSLPFLADLNSHPGTKDGVRQDDTQDAVPPLPTQAPSKSRRKPSKTDGFPPLHIPPPISSMIGVALSKETLTETPTPRATTRQSLSSSISSRCSRHPSTTVRPSTSSTIPPSASSRGTPSNARSSSKSRPQSPGGIMDRKPISSTSGGSGRRSVSSSRRASALNEDVAPREELLIEGVPVPAQSMDEMWKLLKDLSGLPDAPSYKESTLDS
ncbi:uncharacterized protein EI90DRAFT_3045491 [Cantharellus anzutake]|uniref:uncharacterized protein n=1 Tax=Cantharellus anzutake TaxID=1750568 RepID=UPI0019050C54|nr:uncharacterized protein EI90DRAFT_3045491 [Cantharellus anzutake]KAF8336357.1 hypothetical protein EI90DRAFT_3045491 [Cantharellus anzutake]